MQTIGIRELQKNPAVLTRTLETKEYALITKRSNPIGIAISFDDKIITNGLKTSLMIEGYKSGLLSLGQFAKALNISKKKAMQTLSLMGIDVIDYNFDKELEILDKLSGSSK